jgi:hypothetical protein
LKQKFEATCYSKTRPSPLPVVPPPGVVGVPEPGVPEPGVPEPGVPEPGVPEPGVPEPGESVPFWGVSLLGGLLEGFPPAGSVGILVGSSTPSRGVPPISGSSGMSVSGVVTVGTLAGTALSGGVTASGTMTGEGVTSGLPLLGALLTAGASVGVLEGVPASVPDGADAGV